MSEEKKCDCTQEVSIGKIQQNIDFILADIKELKSLIVDNALSKQSISRLWWFVGGITFAVINLSFFVIKKIF